jgi:phosphoglycolate phosphatase
MELREHGTSLGICTNKPQSASDALVQAAGLAPYFDAVVGGDALPVKKPHAGHIGAVLARLGAAGGRAVMVGDSRNDLAAARATGIPCVLVSFGYTQVPAAELLAALVEPPAGPA